MELIIGSRHAFTRRFTISLTAAALLTAGAAHSEAGSKSVNIEDAMAKLHGGAVGDKMVEGKKENRGVAKAKVALDWDDEDEEDS